MSSSRGVSTARIAPAAVWLAAVTTVSRSRTRWRSFPAILGGEHTFACGGCRDGGDDLVGRRRLEDVSGGAGDDCLDNPVLFAAGQDEDPRRGSEYPEACDRLHTGNPRKLDVHQNDIRPQVEHDLDRIFSASGFADDLDATAQERLGQGGTNQLLIIDQHHRDRSSAVDAGSALGWHLGRLKLPGEAVPRRMYQRQARRNASARPGRGST
jgi:hypothetical protein